MRLGSQFWAERPSRERDTLVRYYFYVSFNKADTQQQCLWCARFIHLPARRPPGIKAPGKVTFGSSLKIKCWLSADAVNKGNGVESEGGKTRTLVCACRELCAPPYTRGESELVRRTGRVFSILTLSPETEKLHSAASKSWSVNHFMGADWSFKKHAFWSIAVKSFAAGTGWCPHLGPLKWMQSSLKWIYWLFRWNFVYSYRYLRVDIPSSNVVKKQRGFC